MLESRKEFPPHIVTLLIRNNRTILDDEDWKKMPGPGVNPQWGFGGGGGGGGGGGCNTPKILGKFGKFWKDKENIHNELKKIIKYVNFIRIL